MGINYYRRFFKMKKYLVQTIRHIPALLVIIIWALVIYLYSLLYFEQISDGSHQLSINFFLGISGMAIVFGFLLSTFFYISSAVVQMFFNQSNKKTLVFYIFNVIPIVIGILTILMNLLEMITACSRGGSAQAQCGLNILTAYVFLGISLFAILLSSTFIWSHLKYSEKGTADY